MIFGKTIEERHDAAYKRVMSFINGERVFKIHCNLEDGRKVMFGWVYQYGRGYIDRSGRLSLDKLVYPQIYYTRYYTERSDEYVNLVDKRDISNEKELPAIRLANDLL